MVLSSYYYPLSHHSEIIMEDPYFSPDISPSSSEFRKPPYQFFQQLFVKCLLFATKVRYVYVCVYGGGGDRGAWSTA